MAAAQKRQRGRTGRLSRACTWWRRCCPGSGPPGTKRTAPGWRTRRTSREGTARARLIGQRTTIRLGTRCTQQPRQGWWRLKSFQPDTAAARMSLAGKSGQLCMPCTLSRHWRPDTSQASIAHTRPLPRSERMSLASSAGTCWRCCCHGLGWRCLCRKAGTQHCWTHPRPGCKCRQGS